MDTDRLILVVEDEDSMRTMICDYLTAIGYAVEGVADGKAALEAFDRLRPAMLVLDVMLPGIDGYELVRQIRARSAAPIIMVTARAEEADRLIGFELGADDYLVKPFSIRELAARIRSLFRRSQPDAGSQPIASEGEPWPILAYGPFQVDYAKRRISRQGRVLSLTAMQFSLLVRLIEQPGRVFTRSELLDGLVDGINSDAYERTIDAHVKNIRKQLEDDPARPRYLRTVRAVGYSFVELDATSTSAGEETGL